MGSVLAGEFTGTMEKLVLTLLQANEETYDDGYHTKEKMIEDMEKLHEAGQGKFGTDVSYYSTIRVSKTTFCIALIIALLMYRRRQLFLKS
jgi:hypothetical protein